MNYFTHFFQYLVLWNSTNVVSNLRHSQSIVSFYQWCGV